ncbi:hypothetical protein C5167_016539 [Papaver somniferum]|nr:hypothetical protein C5167_016539 [Papaver somniferum]
MGFNGWRLGLEIIVLNPYQVFKEATLLLSEADDMAHTKRNHYNSMMLRRNAGNLVCESHPQGVAGEI